MKMPPAIAKKIADFSTPTCAGFLHQIRTWRHRESLRRMVKMAMIIEEGAESLDVDTTAEVKVDRRTATKVLTGLIKNPDISEVEVSFHKV